MAWICWALPFSFDWTMFHARKMWTSWFKVAILLLVTYLSDELDVFKSVNTIKPVDKYPSWGTPRMRANSWMNTKRTSSLLFIPTKPYFISTGTSSEAAINGRRILLYSSTTFFVACSSSADEAQAN